MIESYKFYEKGSLPIGIPGEFHAGLVVTVDTDTKEIISVRLMSDGEKAAEDEAEDEVPDLPLDIVPPPPPDARSPFFFGVSPELNSTSEAEPEEGA